MWNVPVAQLDRALDYGLRGLGFESLRVHKKIATMGCYFALGFCLKFEGLDV
jgi:hypothetical protein